MRDIWRDLRHGVRGLARSPGYALVVALTLALGIGANAAIFSVVNGVILQPLPFEEPDGLSLIWTQLPASGDEELAGSPSELMDWRRDGEVFQDVGAIFTGEQNLQWTITRDDETERVAGAFTTWNLFRVLGVDAQEGRTFTEDEGVEGQTDVVILSDRLWRQRFGADPGVVGDMLQVNGDQRRIVGVMPSGFHTDFNASNTGDVDLWVAYAVNPEANRRFRFLNLVGRLAEGMTLEQAQAGADRMARAFLETYPEAYSNDSGYRVRLEPVFERIVGDVTRPLFILQVTVALVLLIACVNVANLLLVRTETRQRELALRRALGASRGVLLRKALVDTTLLSLLGGALGLVLAYGGVELLRAFNPGRVPRMELVRIDGSVLALLAALAVGTGLVMALVPWLRTASVDVSGALREGARSATAGGRKVRLRAVLVTTQMALAVVLVVAAGLLSRSFQRLAAIDLGVRSESVLSMRMDFEAWQFPDINAVQETEERILEEVSRLPGVRSASLAHAEHPLRLNGRWFFEVEGRDPDPALAERMVGIRVVSPGHLETLGQPLLRGRALSAADRAPAPHVIVINRTMADRWFSGEDPVGRHLRLRNAPWDTASYEVVGVAGDVKNEGIREEVRETVLLPLANPAFTSGWRRHMTLYVRTDGSPSLVARPVRQAIEGVDPKLVVYNVQPLDAVVSGTVAAPRFTALLLGIFAVLAMVLASVGIYGVVSYSVAQRTREIGVRMALGAGRRQVQRLVLVQGLWMAVLGIGIGLAGAVAASRALESLLYQVEATDPVTFVGVTGLIFVVALVATFLPARRASRVEPVTALSYD